MKILPSQYCLFLLIPFNLSANVLYTASFISHKKSMTPAILAMAKAGHNVTVFHADVFKHHIRENNVTDESDLVDINQVHQTKLFGLYKWIPGSNDLLKFWKTVHSQCKEKVEALSLKKFDLVVYDIHLSPYQFVFNERLKAPTMFMNIGVPQSGASLTDYFGFHHITGLYLIVGVFNGFASRLIKVLVYSSVRFFIKTIHTGRLSLVAMDLFKSNLSQSNLESKSLGLLLPFPIEINSPTPLNHQISYVPLACEEFSPTGDELNMLGEINSDIIVISSGHEKTAGDYRTDQMIAALRHFPTHKIFWQRNFIGNKSVPSNVLLVDWMPQRALLSHPKTKVFITHAGTKSILEGICAAVPMLVSPNKLLTDQFLNGVTLERLGVGFNLGTRNFDHKTIVKFVSKLLKQQSEFRRKTEHLREMISDRLLNATQSHQFFMERIIRRKNGLQLFWEKGREIFFWRILLLDLCIVFVVLFVAVQKLLMYGEIL